MKPGSIGRGDRLLAERLREGEHGLVGVIARRQGAYHLDELHQRHRVEEMQAAEPVRPLRRRGELGDAERRGVREKDRVRLHERLERGVGLALLLQVLDNRLDDEVARSQRVERRGAGEVAERRVALIGGDFALRDAVLEEPLHPTETLVQRDLVDLAHDGLVAGGGGHLRDTGAHQPTPEHADRLYRHRSSFIRCRRCQRDHDRTRCLHA